MVSGYVTLSITVYIVNKVGLAAIYLRCLFPIKYHVSWEVLTLSHAVGSHRGLVCPHHVPHDAGGSVRLDAVLIAVRLRYSVPGTRNKCYLEVTNSLGSLRDHLAGIIGNRDPMHEVCISHRIPRGWKQQEEDYYYYI